MKKLTNNAEVSSLSSDNTHPKDQGHELLKKGAILEAIDVFDEILSESKINVKEYFEIVFALSNALRLSGDLKKAEGLLNNSIGFAVRCNSKRMEIQLEKSLAAVYIEMAKSNDEAIEKVCNLKHGSRIMNALNKNNSIDAAASDGFSARTTFLYGKRSNAAKVFLTTHKSLSGKHDMYEFENLIWLMRASIKYRYVFLRRAIHLSKVTESNGQANLKMVLSLAIGGNQMFNKFNKA